MAPRENSRVHISHGHTAAAPLSTSELNAGPQLAGAIH